MSDSDTLASRIAALLNAAAHQDLAPADLLRVLIAHKLDLLPMPASGATLARWRALAAVAEFDLSLAKLYEGHTDALAILREMGCGEPLAPGAWCVWAAEAPQAKTVIDSVDDNAVCLNGSKSWCSGAATADHALLTAWTPDGQAPQLVQISLRQSGVVVDSSVWKAVGMARSASLEVRFDGASGVRVGFEGQYLQRPGFWQGGAGVAACWWGGSVGIAKVFKHALQGAPASGLSPFKLAALGRVELALAETAAVLRESAAWIDSHPTADASRVALQARLSAEQCAKRVLDEVGNAMGATPFCRDKKFAQAAADLPVFIRQSHAERDFAALGERAHASEGDLWTL